jgi:hypothetical protein
LETKLKLLIVLKNSIINGYENANICNICDYNIVDEMLEFSGKEAIITSSNWYGVYKLDIDEGMWDWKSVLLKPI